jgi:hypothetical protein
VTTVIAIAVFVLFFTIFALLGPAERSRGCGGRGPGEERCGKCPLGSDQQPDPVGCPGAKALKNRSRKTGG